MSRIGILHGNKYLFTHHDPQTGRYWTDEIRNGVWVDSRNINFNVNQPEKTKSRFTRKEKI